MAGFPDEDPDVILEFAPGADVTADPDTWVFTDLSSRLIQSPITVTQGVVVGTGTAKTGSATGILCTNDDGWLTPFLETSPYWPYVDAGTPARLSIRTAQTPYVTDTFTRTVASGWGTADSGQTWAFTTGLSVAGGKGLMSIGTVSTTATNRIAETHRDVDATFDVSIPVLTTGTDSNAFGLQLHRNSTGGNYLLCLLEFRPGGTVSWTVWSVVASAFTLVTSVIQPSLTYTAGTTLRGRCELVNGRLRCRAWNPLSGSEPTSWVVDNTVTANVAGSVNVGTFGWVQAGVTNTMPMVFSVDNVTVKAPKMTRIEGYLTGVQPTFWVDSSGTPRSQVQMSIGGVGSRLEKLAADELSPLRRSIQKSTSPPIAYWPLEDKSGATSGASAFPDQPPMVVTGPAVFAFDLGLTDDNLIPAYGTPAIASLAAGAKMTAPVPLTAATAWTVTVEHRSYTPTVGGGVTSMRLFEWQTPSSSFNRWALIATTSSYIARAYNDAAGTSTDVVTCPFIFAGLCNYSVRAVQNGSNIDCTILINSNPLTSGSTAGQIGGYAPTRLTLNPDQMNVTASVDPDGIKFLVGHAYVHAVAVQALPFYIDGTLGRTLRADRAWAYEAAHRRGMRVAAEERIPFTVLGAPYTSGITQLNAQQPGAFQELMREAIDSESGGLLYEGGFGYVHDPRTNRYNRAVALTVDMSTYRYSKGTDPKEVLVPKLDARGPNSWTVERTNGSAATYAADAAYRLRRGTINDKATLDVLYDSDTAPHAQWRTHLNVDGQGANYPNLVIDLAANPGLIDGWLVCTIGSRMQRTNQPTIAGIGTIDQIIDGMSETITPKQVGGPGWVATLDTSPASVWNTGVWDSATSLWQPANTTPSVLVTTTATSWSMNSNGEPWITGAVSLRAKLGAEQVLITNISGSGSAWTFTVTRSVNGVVASHAVDAEAIVLLDAGTWAL